MGRGQAIGDSEEFAAGSVVNPGHLRLLVKVGSQNRMFLYSPSRTMKYIDGVHLRNRGLDSDTPAVLEISYSEKGPVAYHRYTGGPLWIPTVPKGIGRPGDVIKIRIRILRIFVESLPSLALGNSFGADWMTDIARVNSFSLDGDQLLMRISQDSEEGPLSNYTIMGKISPALGFNRGSAFAQFEVEDFFGNRRAMRIYHDGHSLPAIGLQAGRSFLRVRMMSFDGVRCKIAYDDGSCTINVATIYIRDPSHLYVLGEARSDGIVAKLDAKGEYERRDVVFRRRLETAILFNGSDYDLGRLGAEIAYT